MSDCNGDYPVVRTWCRVNLASRGVDRQLGTFSIICWGCWWWGSLWCCGWSSPEWWPFRDISGGTFSRIQVHYIPGYRYITYQDSFLQIIKIFLIELIIMRGYRCSEGRIQDIWGDNITGNNSYILYSQGPELQERLEVQRTFWSISLVFTYVWEQKSMRNEKSHYP